MELQKPQTSQAQQNQSIVFNTPVAGSTFIDKKGTVHRFYNGELRVDPDEADLLKELREAVKTSGGQITEFGKKFVPATTDQLSGNANTGVQSTGIQNPKSPASHDMSQIEHANPPSSTKTPDILGTTGPAAATSSTSTSVDADSHVNNPDRSPPNAPAQQAAAKTVADAKQPVQASPTAAVKVK